MIIEPKGARFFCTTSHPEGCKENVRKQITYKKIYQNVTDPKVLVIGASTGYGLLPVFFYLWLCDAATVGVIFDKPASGSRTATAGWYNTAAFEEFAAKTATMQKPLTGMPFLPKSKQTIDLIKQELGQIDCVVYSLAAPKRTTSDQGTTYTSVPKCTGEDFVNTTVDLKTKEIVEVTVPKATEQEIHDTIKVMGGEDWKDWMTGFKRPAEYWRRIL